jgi:hypothetical protein
MEDVSIIRESIEEQGGKAMSALRFIFGSFLHSKSSTRDSSKANKKDKRDTKNKSKKEQSE